MLGKVFLPKLLLIENKSLPPDKDLFKDKASIAFNVRDLFNSRKRRSDNFTDTFNNYSEFQWRVRSFNLAFTYRFNQQNKRERGDRGGEGGGDNFDFEG